VRVETARARPLPVTMCGMPTISPRALTSAPPELPGRSVMDSRSTSSAALARMREYCRAAAEAIDDGECRERISTIDELARELYSKDGHLRFERTQTSGRDFLRLRILRELYRAYFSGKLFLKAKTPLARMLVTRDLSWI